MHYARRTMHCLALVLLAACASADRAYILSFEPTLGAMLPINDTPSSGFVVGGVRQSWPAYRVTFHGVEYLAGVDAAHRIRYIETTDAHFRTREGLRVGATLAEVLAVGGREPLYEEGWGRYSLLQSGWLAFFAAPSANDIDGPPRVLSYFRRDSGRVDQTQGQ